MVLYFSITSFLSHHQMKRERDVSDDTPDTSVTTAVDYLKEQDELEKQARELMPYDPNECTFNKGELRQPVFACLTCYRQNGNPVGVCYSCSIQCHSNHDIVELFSKREFVCDCGTTRMAKGGACKLRTNDPGSQQGSQTIRPRTGSVSMGHQRWGSQSNLDLPADDIPGSNSYNHNYKGLFCSCEEPYNPLEETGNMIQCYFGFECGEDWYHEDCILGYRHRALDVKKEESKKDNIKVKGENLLDSLSEPETDAFDGVSPGEDSSNKEATKVPHFPSLEAFDVFICWKCASRFVDVFEEFERHDGIVYTSLPHFNDVQSLDEWERLHNEFKKKTEISNGDIPDAKRIKLEHKPDTVAAKSYFLSFSFRDKLKDLRANQNTKVQNFLRNYEYLYLADPVYEPPEEDDASSASGSLLDLGTEALSNVPREQALKGLEAYDKIKSKLRDFFKPFAEEGKVVTEEEVRAFFGNVKKEKE